MTTAARRLARLEAAEIERVHALSHREILEGGHFDTALDRLPADERAELETILQTALSDRGHIDRLLLTPEEQARASELLQKVEELAS
ncbi:MAG: hypothetical protein H0U67_16410 [Gemmatimonadetes bacterium]|nr:hypothetical protein [Gemmatimonadota bacterium]